MRGEHVADLVPAGSASGGWRLALIADGRLTPASRVHGDAEPRPAKLGYSLSERLVAEREDEDR